MADTRAQATGSTKPQARFAVFLSAYSAATITGLLLLSLPDATDYVGFENDDVMRLVEVRNFLAGQSWFDLTEYRLGLAGGTLMHWSRLIDLPIAGLMLFFGLFLSPLAAEAAALGAWPLLLAIPTLAIMGLGGKRMAGRSGMHVALALTAVFLVTGNHFLPGAIDHHNVQLLLSAIIAVMLTDARYRVSSFALAGFAGALALAIGAETTPLVAIASLVVACLWAWHGQPMTRAAAAFALTITLSVTLAFFATVPPGRYGVVTCDNLSLGYYGITAVGGALLFLAVLIASQRSLAIRFTTLAAVALAVLVTASVLAPQCLGDPLADLDPLLRAIWLDNVSEARSFIAVVRSENGLFGGYYAPGLFAIFVCLFRILRGDRAELHLILLPLILVSWIIALIQVRGAVFSNLLAILPLTLLIAELRRGARHEPDNIGVNFLYIVSVMMAMPVVWAFGGLFAVEGTAGIGRRLHPQLEMAVKIDTDCTSPTAMRQLSRVETGVVAAPIDLGPAILRYTPHRALSGPYHRNQGGMLTEMHIGLARPSEASAFLRGADVTWLAFCPTEGETREIARTKPDGLYAAIMRGDVPRYLVPLRKPEGSPLQLYRVALERM